MMIGDIARGVAARVRERLAWVAHLYRHDAALAERLAAMTNAELEKFLRAR